MKATQFQGAKNQIVIEDKGERIFQSYESIIVKIDKEGKVTLGRHWNYSVTTTKYRNMFLGETTKETQAKIDSGEYVVDDNLL
jgi:hypothetical protein